MTDRALKPGWTWLKFGDVVRLNTDRIADPQAEGIERYVGIEHIEPEDLRIRSWGLVEEGTTFTNYFKPGQVLFVKRRAYQRKVALVEFEGVCSGDIYVLEPQDDRLLPDLLPFICQTEAFFAHAVNTSAGSLSPRTNWRLLAEYEFALPPLAEQRKLVHILTVADSVYESRRQAVVCASETLQAASMEQFTHLLDGNVTMLRLADACSFGPQSGLYKAKDFYGKGIPMVHMGELFGTNCITDDTKMQLVDLDAEEVAKYGLTSNDLLFGRRSVVLEGAGRCIMVKGLRGPVAFESSILRITVNPGLAESEYLYEWFNSPQGSRQIRSIVTFTTVAGVKGSDVARLIVPVPALTTQRSIAEHLSTIRAGISRAEQGMQLDQQLFALIRESLLGEAA